LGRKPKPPREDDMENGQDGTGTALEALAASGERVGSHPFARRPRKAAGRAKLTKRTLDVLVSRAERELEPGAKRYLKLRDTDDGRIVAKAMRTGDGRGRVTLDLRYWDATRRERWFRLGEFGAVTIEEARAKARRVGDDPAADRDEERKRGRTGSTVAELCRRYVADRERRGRAVKTLLGYRCLIDGTKDSAPGALVIAKTDLGKTPTDKLTPEAVKRFHEQNHTRPVLANRAVALVRAAYEWAEIRPNPAALKRGWKFPERRRRRYFTDGELSRLGTALAKLDEAPEMVGFFKCLLLTGARPGELLRLKWDDVDFASKRINLGGSKTGEADPRAVTGLAITPPVAETLRGLKPIERNPYVFASRRVKGEPLNDYAHAWRRLVKAAGITGNDAVAYTARHTIGTLAASALPLNVVSGLLGHASPTTTKRYAHDHGDAISRGATTVATAIASKLAGKAAR
jgi:integrase